MPRPAVFLDRDDTLVVDSGFIDHPDKVALMPGAVEAVNRLHAAGFAVVVATNQSGVARGFFDEQRLASIHDRLQQLLANGGASLDGIYYCPYLSGDEATVEKYRRDSDLRKPAPGMLLQAAGEMDLDLTRSWMIGDGGRDIEAGRAAGCRTILLNPGGNGAAGDVRPTFRTDSLLEAVMIVEREDHPDHQSPHPSGDPGQDRPIEDETKLLREIRDLLDRKVRADLHDDFSIWRLLATLLQMLALVAAGWGVYAMFNEQPSAAVTRLALAAFLQLMMISLVLTDRRR